MQSELFSHLAKKTIAHLILFTTLIISFGNQAEAFNATGSDSTSIAKSGQYSVEDCNAIFDHYGIQTEAKFFIETYQITFKNTFQGPYGKMASGLIVIPKIEKSAKGQPLTLLYQHGTITARKRSPSISKFPFISCLYGSQGFSLIAPDYLGLGINEGFHPYLHVDSLNHNNMDLLTALRNSNHEILNHLQPKLAILGYSQGGHSSLSIHQHIESLKRRKRSPAQLIKIKMGKLQQEHFETAKELNVLLSIPMAGPYDMSQISPRYMLTRPKEKNTNIYITYLIYSYSKIYGGIYSDFELIFKQPNQTLLQYFDGNYSINYITNHIPTLPNELFSDELISSLLDPEDQRFKKELSLNNVYNWRPQAPVHFIYAGSDRSVPPENAQKAYRVMKAKGADVKIYNIGEELNHRTGSIPSQALALKILFEAKKKL